MARQLWLLRHADAEPHGARPDAERRLTERGELQARMAGLALARLQVRFEAALSSPKQRAVQTATLALEQLGDATGALLELEPSLAAGLNGERARELLAGLDADARALLVGHEPDFSSVVCELTGARIDLKKGGMAVVRVDSPSSELLMLARPREVALMAGQRATAEQELQG
jgi:phosphohistidine phosphatase